MFPDLPGLLLIAGGAIYGLLGTAHAVYTLQDLARPRRIVPEDPAVIAAMQGTGVRLARGETTMWRAWVGFNLSHSLGALLFAALTIGGGLTLARWTPPHALLLAPVAVSGIYLVLARRYWFRIPVAGTALATLAFLGAFLLT